MIRPVFKKLQKALALKDHQSFQAAFLELPIHILPLPLFQECCDLLLNAHYQWDFASLNFTTHLENHISSPKSQDLWYLIQVLKCTYSFLPDLMPGSLQNVRNAINALHPLEIPMNFSVQLIKTLMEGLYECQDVLDCVNQSVLQSFFPPGRLGQEITCLLIWSSIEMRSFNKEIWDLIEEVIFRYNRFARFSFLHRVSILHALALKDDYVVPEQLIHNFTGILFDDQAPELIFEASQVVSYLKMLKNIEVNERFHSNLQSLYAKASKHRGGQRKNNYSLLHKDVEGVLKELGFDFQSEYCIYEPFLIEIDIFIQKLGTVIEVQGPFHYLKPSRQVSVKTLKKHHILEKLGYKVVDVPHFIWKELSRNSKKDFIINSLAL